MYIRNPKCICNKYKDINDIPLNERINCTSYWRKGYIFENGKSYECPCHTFFRLKERYDMLSTKWNLPNSDGLKNLKYIGDSKNSFDKLMKIDELIDNKKLKGMLFLITGTFNNQKTTSIAHFIFKIITRGKTSEYISFNDIIKKIQDQEDISIYKNVDYLIIDDCFQGEIINFKSLYNTLYNIILRQKENIILVSNLNEKEIMDRKDKPFYTELIPIILDKINKYNTRIEFNDNLEKLKVFGNKQIDLWS